MPFRTVIRSGRARRSNRRYQWVGMHQTDVAVGASAVVLNAVPAVNDITNARNATLMAMHVCFAVRNPDTLTNRYLAMNIQKTEYDGLGSATGVVTPYSTSAFDLANGDILDWCYLPTPDDNSAVQVVQHKVKARRKLQRGNHGIVIALQTSGAPDLRVGVLSRALLAYG